MNTILQNAINQITAAAELFKEATENNFVKTTNTNTNAIEILNSLQSTSEYKDDNFTKLNNAKVSINSLEEIKKVVGTIHREFNTQTTPTIKSYIKLLRKIHPEIDKYEDGLTYFKPISDDIASRTLGYYPDTQSLDLDYWGSDYAIPVRLNIQYKLEQTDLDEINDSYKELNKAMVRNLSKEFFEERAAGNIFPTVAHDYHIAGDSSYSQHLRNPLVILGIISSLLVVLQSAIRLINYINPISNYGEALSGPVDIEIKDKIYSVDIKGSPYNNTIKAVDKSVLKPK